MKLSTRDLALVSLFAALTAVGGFIKIPIPYVPFTLQYLFCAFAGILLGSKLGAASQILYVAIGLLGIPVFTQGGGPAYIFQPTFGYLIGFIVGAYAIGKLTEKLVHITFLRAFTAMLVGLFFVYFFGVVHLYVIYNLYFGSHKTFIWAIFYGFILCVGGDLVLSALAAAVSVRVVPILNKLGFRRKMIILEETYEK